jgi:peptidoglycan hydrolase CwlO-like protein
MIGPDASCVKGISPFFEIRIPSRREKEIMKRISVLLMVLIFALAVVLTGCGDKAKEQKEAYQKEIESKLSEINKKMDELKGKAGDVKEDMKAEFNQQMDALSKDREAANKKLEELKAAGTKNWENLKEQMDKAVKVLEEQYDKLKSLLQ